MIAKAPPMKCLFRLIFLCAVVFWSSLSAANPSHCIKQGWEQLVLDNDTGAIRFFEEARLEAHKKHDQAAEADAYLYLGIATYGSWVAGGIENCTKASVLYACLAQVDPLRSRVGSGRCLQLMSTIRSREGKWKEALELSREALSNIQGGNDTSGTEGLIYASFGAIFEHLGAPDSSGFYYRKALSYFRSIGNMTYLPNALLKVALMDAKNNRFEPAEMEVNEALMMADRTRNRQALVLSWIALGRICLLRNYMDPKADAAFDAAARIADSLSDQSFRLNVLSAMVDLSEKRGEFRKAFTLQKSIAGIQDSLRSADKDKAIATLQVQFEVAAKDRKLELLSREQEVTGLTNTLLWGSILVICAVALLVILALRRLRIRDRDVLQAKVEVSRLRQEQQEERHRHLQQELSMKEQQLSGMALQMLQKNELLLDLKTQLEEDKNPTELAGSLQRMIQRGLNQEKDWDDFNRYFEGLNASFYDRVKQNFPDITSNDLRICALIRLNLSSKEMAGILNISADSVKTARYRLRKKLGLNTEENLNEFILKL